MALTSGVWIGVIAIVVLVLSQRSRAEETKAEHPAGPSIRRQLDTACDVLRRAAVKGSYGWGWPSDIQPRPVENVSSRNRIEPDIDLRVTAAAGLVLELAGRELKSEANGYAAVQASRAIASVLLPTGQVPSTARLVPKPSGHQENVGIVPSRAPTTSALALMLIVIEARAEQPDERIHSAATRAATWLARQQTGGGGWQTAYPPGVGPKARRIIRLDGPEYRDATYALMLAARVLGKREYSMAADRSIEQLLRVRIREEASPGEKLWGPAYSLGNEAVRDIPELPYGIDLIATRYAMETLLAGHLVAGRKNLDKELAIAAEAMNRLPKTDGHWEPRYPMFPRKAAPSAPSDQTNDTSKDNDENEKPAAPVFDDAALLNLLTAVNRSRSIGAEKFGRELWTEAGPSERLAAAMCHLSDDLLTVQPRAAKNADLPDAVTKAWTLLIKLRAEPPAPAKRP